MSNTPGNRPPSIIDDLLYGLPVRWRNRIRNRLTWKHVLGWGAHLLLVVLGTVLLTGILQGISFDYWKTTAQPWLAAKGPTITNGDFVLLSCGWLVVLGLLVIVGVMTNWLIVVRSRWYGNYVSEKTEKEKREQEVSALNNRVIDLTRQVDHLTQEVVRQNEEKIAKLTQERESSQYEEFKILEVLRTTDRELYILFTERLITQEMESNFYRSVCRRTFDLFDRGNHAFRASIYTPSAEDPEILIIKWELGVGDESRRVNRWYVGDKEPTTVGMHRGIPGAVYRAGEGRVRDNARSDLDFWDAHNPPRTVLPYRSILLTVIHPDNKAKKCGVLAVDSWTYTFTEHDLALVDHIAVRIGWLMEALEQRTNSKQSNVGGNME